MLVRAPFLLLLMLNSNIASAADWSVGAAPSDDPQMSAATAMNADGHALFLWSKHVGDRYQVFAELHLGGEQRFGEIMPTYRIDGSEVVDTDAIRQEGEALGAVWGHLGSKAAFWLVWTSIQDAVLPSDMLHAWFTGSDLSITYATHDGASRVTTFSLDGAGPAILTATGLRSE